MLIVSSYHNTLTLLLGFVREQSPDNSAILIQCLFGDLISKGNQSISQKTSL